MFSLSSFAPDFFLAQGEPYDHILVNLAGQPVSLYGAISKALEDSTFRAEAAEVLGCNPEYVTVEVLYDLAVETDSCYDLGVPTEVCITHGLTVLVYE